MTLLSRRYPSAPPVFAGSGFLLVAVCLVLAGTARGQSSREIRKAQKELEGAAGKADTVAFCDAMSTVLGDRPSRGVPRVLEAFGVIVGDGDRIDTENYYSFHSSVARALGKVVDGNLFDQRLVRDLVRLQKKARHWASRMMLIELAYTSERLDLKAFATAALEDGDGRVIRRALFYLRNDETLPTVDAILERYLEVDVRDSKTYRGAEWDRTRLAFRDALTRLIKLNLPAAVDYENYIRLRRHDKDFFDPPQAEAQGISKLSLFGAEISGKNIAFVIDVSGSMMATDKIVFDDGDPGKTVVGDPRKDPARIEARRRITRARKELARVVRNLPEDVRFNVIPYSTDVGSWKKKLTLATPAAKKEAADFIAALKAEGITVTDYALEAAFADLQIDTVYLITDGAPTHRGSRGPERPVDADDIIERIYRRMEHLNFLRGVRIFTLGFPDADEEFLKKLAAEHSGKYTPIK